MEGSERGPSGVSFKENSLTECMKRFQECIGAQSELMKNYKGEACEGNG